MSVKIFGKEYNLVSERVQAAHEAQDLKQVTTEVLTDTDKIVVIKASVMTSKGTFTGISAIAKATAKFPPYETCETSAVGRALAFAGYGTVDSIASADEIKKATPPAEAAEKAIKVVSPVKPQYLVCEVCGDEISEKIKSYSMEHYNGKVLCMACQQKEQFGYKEAA